jgi:CheY-like chemotaxis protein
VERVAVLGHSILGMLAIEYGRRRPASVSHVIAVGTPPRGDMVRLVAEGRAFFEANASEERKRLLRENLAALPPVLDLGLPVMGGLDVARELRRHPEMTRARLVALTGWGQAEDRRHTHEAGFDHHLTKPADPDALLQLLATLGGAV